MLTYIRNLNVIKNLWLSDAVLCYTVMCENNILEKCMSDNYYRGNNTGGGSFVDDARRQFEQTTEKSADVIASFAGVQRKDDGKSYWMGIEVTPDMEPFMVHVTSGLPAILNNALNGGVYKYATRLHEKLGTQIHGNSDSLAAHNFGLRSAAAAMTLLIGLQPIMEVAQSVKNKSASRDEIQKNLEVVISTNKDYGNNEVIKTAMERTHKIMVAGFKNAAAQLPTVLANGYFALGNHKQLKKDKSREFAERSAFQPSSGGPINHEDNFFEKYASERKKLDEYAKKHGIDKDSKEFEHLRDEWKNRSRPDSSGHYDHSVSADATTQYFVTTGALVGNVFAKRQVAKTNMDELNRPTAYQLIMDLRKQVNDGYVSKGSDISQQVVEIFQQNEIDRRGVGFGPALAEKLNPLAQRIAEVISNGELDPMVLINLVGDRKVVDKNRNFVNVAHLEKLIDEQRNVFSPHEKTPLDEFLADFKDPKRAMAAIKENLKTLEGDAKAVFASMFSDEVLISAGIRKKDILPLRERGHDYMCEFIKSTTVELAKKTQEELKELGLAEKQIESIRTLNELILDGKEKEVKAALSGDAISAVRTAGLNNADKDYWKNSISKGNHVSDDKAPVVKHESAVARVKNGRANEATVGLQT